MSEIKPMGEDCLHLVCLHEGPVDTTTVEVPPDRALGGHPSHPWSDETLKQVAARCRANKVYHPRPADFMTEILRLDSVCDDLTSVCRASARHCHRQKLAYGRRSGRTERSRVQAGSRAHLVGKRTWMEADCQSCPL